MKRLIILLLVISALFTLGCANKNFSEMSDGEILQNISARGLYGTWKPVGDHSDELVLSKTGAKLGDEIGGWNYGKEGVRVQIGDGAFYCNVLVQDKKIRLELDGHLFVRDEQITEHTLSPENFWDYFKLAKTDSWQENEGAMWYEREYVLTLQDKYGLCYADGIEITAELTKRCYDYEIDYAEKIFKITQKDESYEDETTNSSGVTDKGRIVIHTAFLKEGESYSFPVLSGVKVTSVEGKLYTIE